MSNVDRGSELASEIPEIGEHIANDGGKIVVSYESQDALWLVERYDQEGNILWRDLCASQAGVRETLTAEGATMKKKLISLEPWQPEGGWRWTWDSTGDWGAAPAKTTEHRTDSNYEGEWVRIVDYSWKQMLGHMQASWPTDRTAMLKELARRGYDVSGVQ